jgi:hypothetical protein
MANEQNINKLRQSGIKIVRDTFKTSSPALLLLRRRELME